MFPDFIQLMYSHCKIIRPARQLGDLPDIDTQLGITAEELAAGEEADGDPAHPEPRWDLPPEFEWEMEDDGAFSLFLAGEFRP
jgi:hypothetical protein